MTEQDTSVTITVGQKKATNWSKETFDANESITLTNTTAIEAMLLRKILRIKLMSSIIFDMIAYDSMVSESLVPEDVTTSVHISEHQLNTITEAIRGYSNDELPNKELLVEHLGVTQLVVNDIKDQLD